MFFVERNAKDARFCGVVLELDDLAHDIDHYGRAADTVFALKHSQVDGFVLLAADHLHDPAQGHVDGVDRLFVRRLRDADDHVTGFETAVSLGGATGNQVHDFYIRVFSPQAGPDALQLEAHLDVEVVLVDRPLIRGVGIERSSQGTQKHFKYVAGVVLLDAVEVIFVAF